MSRCDGINIMDDDRKELLGRLFNVACDVLERAHETAAAGQAHTMDRKQAAHCARDLGEAAARLSALAETMRLVAKDRPRRERG